MREIKENHLRLIVADLLVDYRCACRDGLLDYANECREKVVKLYKLRRDISYDHWGWPTCLK